MSAARRPKLSGSSSLSGASGEKLRSLGRGNFHIKLGSLQIDRSFEVAQIEDEALLGIDILQNGKGGAADISLKDGLIHWQGVSIPCVQVGMHKATRTVKVADHYTVPPLTEVILDVFVQPECIDHHMIRQEMIVEPTDNFTEKYGLMMAPTIVDTKSNPTVKVRIMNPGVSPVSLNQDARIAEAYPIQMESEENILLQNNAEETEEFFEWLSYSEN